jgi:hypothetical protein
MNVPRRKRLGILAALSPPLLMFLSAAITPSELERTSRSEVVEGFQLRLVDLRRDGDAVKGTYVLERVGEEDHPFPGYWTDMVLHVVDAKGNPKGCTDRHKWSYPWRFEEVHPHKEFLQGRAALSGRRWLSKAVVNELFYKRYSRFEGTVEFVPAPGARYLVLGLGVGEDIRTRRVALPQ